MTTERIDIQVDDSQLTQLIGTLRDLVNGLNRVDREADDTADAMDRLEREVRDVGKAAQSTGSRDMKSFATGIGGAVAAFGGFEAAKALAQATFSVLQEGYTRFLETNEEAAERAADFTGALNGTLLAFGEQIAQSPNFISVQEKLIQLFSDAGDGSSRLGDTIQSLVDGGLWLLEGAVDAVVWGIDMWVRATDVVSGVIELLAVHIGNQISLLNLLRLGALRVALVIADYLVGAFNSVISTFQDMVRTIAPFADTLGIDLTGVIQTLDAVGDSGEELVTGIRGMLEENTAAIGDTVDAVVDRTRTGLDRFGRAWTAATAEYTASATNIVRETEEVTRNSGGAARALENQADAVQELSEGQIALASAMEIYNAKIASETIPLVEKLTEAQEKLRLASRDAGISDKGISSLQAQNELIKEQIAAQRELAAQAEEERRRTILDAQTTATEAGFAFGQSAIDEMFASSDDLGLRIGQAFSDTAFNTLSQVAPDLLGVTGPWGAAISGGIGLIGSVVSGLFGRERRRREREARAARTQNFNTSTNIILTNQFGGIIGDRRAVASTVSDATRDAIRRGA